MSTLDRFKDAYSNAKLTRTPDGVLEVRFHTDGTKLVFNGQTHEQFTTRNTRIGLTQRLRRVIDEGIAYGLAPEGITAAEVARMAAAQDAA